MGKCRRRREKRKRFYQKHRKIENKETLKNNMNG